MPLVPVTVSRKMAAIVCGPSSWITSSSMVSDCSAVSQPRSMPWYGSSTWTTPGMPGSVGQRRGSPVSVMAPAVAP